MRSIAILLLLTSLPAGAVVVTDVAPVPAAVNLTVAPKLLESADIAKAIDLYNSANSMPRYFGLGTVSSHLFLSEGERSVEFHELPALIAQGKAVTIKHSSLVMDTSGVQAPTLLLSTPKSVSSLEQLRQWAEQARTAFALGGFGDALDHASTKK